MKDFFTKKRLLTIRKIMIITLAVVLTATSILIFPFRKEDGPAGGLFPDIPSAQAADRSFDETDPLWNAARNITPLSSSEALAGQTPRDGFILAPTVFTLTGIDPVSTFVLRTPGGYENSTPEVFIDRQPQPFITREDGNTFIITPVIPLTSNNVFTFRLTRESGEDITWAFQTAEIFEIASTLPRDQSANVPVRTGIEITFSKGDALDISEHFSIFPHVEGKFTHRGPTVIFMPAEALEHSRIYTVTVSSGLSLPNSSDIITSDLVFAFETAPDSSSSSWDRTSSVYFYDAHVQFPSFEAPYVRFWLNYDRDKSRPEIDFELYRINDRAQAINAVNKLANTPWWSQVYQTDRFVDVSRLTRISSTQINTRVEDDWGWNETFTLPNTLSPGFYVLNAKTNDTAEQMIIQITDLAVQVIADGSKALVWVNDMTTGMPASGASVRDPIANKSYEVSSYGIAVVERMMSEGDYLIITATDGKEHVVFAHSSAYQTFYRNWWSGDMYYSYEMGWDDWGWNPWRFEQSANDHYWSALQLDRTLFQRSDTLSLWGFAQNRRRQENITHVTAVMRESSWWYYGERDTLHRQNIQVNEGAYSGEIRLPNLDPGYYELAIYHGDLLLNSIYFNIMDYVKPPYQLTVSASKTAIFAGERVDFTAKTEFFEGTPVPDLDISYNSWGWGLRTPGGGQGVTNLDGIIELSVTPTAEPSTRSDRVQGERSLGFMAEATLPETGWVYRDANVRVFVNDIIVRPQASRTGRDATLTVNVHNITLDRINDGTAEHWGDFLDTPKSGQRISVEIVEHYWEAIHDGDRYDHITRQVTPKYRYELRTNSLERFELTTNTDGTASRDFRVPDRENASYQAQLTTTDGNGRTIWHDVYIGRDYTDFYLGAGDDYPFLYGADPEGYDIGDEVGLTIMRGTEPISRGNYLFIVVQDGVMNYQIGKNTLEFTFGERHVPNVQVFAYHFNGHTYHTSGQMTQRLRYNPTHRNLLINVTSNQDAYRPGDMATITVTTTDPDGNPKAANVNISLVDEALLALMDYSVDTLAMLYGNVNDNLNFSLASHRTFISDGLDVNFNEDDAYRYAGGNSVAEPSAMYDMAMEAAPAADEAESGSDTRIRERFEDTAIFASLRTNAQGEASFTFMLPDNITTWRVTASAISDDLYAGNTLQSVRVTQPMFLHYTLGRTFLTGDAPHIGVNAYGTSLAGGENVTFEVWREDDPSDVRTATGVSFARVNIPLWGMDAGGTGALIIRATTSNGYSDAVKHTYQVINSHRQIDSAAFYDVTPDTVFDINTGGLTNITFTDRGRGQFLSELFVLRNLWNTGARVEGLVAKREAGNLIRTHFPDVSLFGEASSFSLLEYQTENGGIAILPYANSDLQTTVMLLPFILDEVNQASLKSYLYTAFNGTSANNKMLALYGLAMLGEPVLLDLQQFAAQPDLSVRNAAYVALGLNALGERQPARELYNSRIAPHVQHVEPYYRVDVGAARADILDATSVVALLAAQLGLPESLGLHNYAANYRYDAPHRFNDDALLLNIERLAFISYDIKNHTGSAAGITYELFGETVTRELGHGGSYTLRIPAQNMDEFRLVSVAGEVGAVSITSTPLENMQAIDNDITIRRDYFRGSTNTRATTFAQDELVRVQITVNYTARSMSGSYEITDFLPAGLTYVANSARFDSRDSLSGWWAYSATEGQRVTFYDYNGRFDRNHTYYYYARVINPGTFKAEGPMAQNLNARDYMAVGADTVITITG